MRLLHSHWILISTATNRGVCTFYMEPPVTSSFYLSFFSFIDFFTLSSGYKGKSKQGSKLYKGSTITVVYRDHIPYKQDPKSFKDTLFFFYVTDGKTVYIFPYLFRDTRSSSSPLSSSLSKVYNLNKFIIF